MQEDMQWLREVAMPNNRKVPTVSKSGEEILERVRERMGGPKKNYTYRLDTEIADGFANFCKEAGFSASVVLEELMKELMAGKNRTK
jgi:hypothetical protein